MDNLGEQLKQLVIATCKSLPGSVTRQRAMTHLIRVIKKSNKLWRDSSAYYEDALQQTWLYFCRNICEASTGAAFDPNKANVITWMNAYLKRRLQDYQIEESLKQSQTISEISNTLDEFISSVDLIASPTDSPPILLAIRKWANHERKLTKIYLQQRPDVNCQVLILKRLPPETSWKELAQEFNLPVSTLSSFYQRKCLPLLREFCQLEGYF